MNFWSYILSNIFSNLWIIKMIFLYTSIAPLYLCWFFEFQYYISWIILYVMKINNKLHQNNKVISRFNDVNNDGPSSFSWSRKFHSGSLHSTGRNFFQRSPCLQLGWPRTFKTVYLKNISLNFYENLHAYTVFML